MDKSQDVSRLLCLLIFFFFFCKRTVPSQLSGLGRTAPVYIKVRPDLAYQMRFGLTSSGHQTAGSPPSSPPQIINLVKFTADKNAGKINIGHGTHLSLNIVTRTRTSSSSSEEISKASNYAMCGRAQQTRQSAKQHLLPDKSNLWQAVSAQSTPVSHILCTLIYAISSQK